MDFKKYRRCYFLCFLCVLVICLYTIIMGVRVLAASARYGYVPVEEYPKYIIPYTPLCLALLLITLLMPLLFRWCKRWTLPAASLLGSAAFLLAEMGFEGIRVLEGYSTLPLESWQYSLCIATPEVLQSIGDPIYAENNPAYKVHYYLIALVLLLCAVQCIYLFLKMCRDGDISRRRPLIAGLCALLVFAGLCVLACFTAFYRNGTRDISSLSAALMALFFIAFGTVAGPYTGTLFYGKKPLLSRWMPVVIAILITAAMYVGELILMGGVLFQLGNGWAFIPAIGPFAIADMFVMLASGVITYGVMAALGHRKEQRQ